MPSDPAEPWRWVNFVAILVTYTGLTAIGIPLQGGHDQAIDWLLPVIIALLALGVVGVWVLLTHANISHADRS